MRSGVRSPYAPPDEMKKAAEVNRDVEISGFFGVRKIVVGKRTFITAFWLENVQKKRLENVTKVSIIRVENVQVLEL